LDLNLQVAHIKYVSTLLAENELPPESLNHNLQGNYKGYSEFHIGGDLLVIYSIENDFLKLVRIGSHAQLFE